MSSVPTPAFNPTERYVHPQTGLEYQDFGTWFCGADAVKNDRNWVLQDLRRLHYPEEGIHAWWQVYDSLDPRTSHQVRDIRSREAARNRCGAAWCGRSTFGHLDAAKKRIWADQLWAGAAKPSFASKVFGAGSGAAGDGAAGVVQPQADPVHAADKSVVRRRVGP